LRKICNPRQRYSNEDGRGNQGEENLLELDGEVEVAATTPDGWAERIVVGTAREVHHAALGHSSTSWKKKEKRLQAT
jgi:hypothetical protein